MAGLVSEPNRRKESVGPGQGGLEAHVFNLTAGFVRGQFTIRDLVLMGGFNEAALRQAVKSLVAENCIIQVGSERADQVYINHHSKILDNRPHAKNPLELMQHAASNLKPGHLDFVSNVPYLNFWAFQSFVGNECLGVGVFSHDTFQVQDMSCRRTPRFCRLTHDEPNGMVRLESFGNEGDLEGVKFFVNRLASELFDFSSTAKQQEIYRSVLTLQTAKR